MGWRIELTDAARKALAKLDRAAAKRITRFLHERVAPASDPRRLGKRLQGELGEYWRFRVGPYRVIAHVEDEEVRVLVVRVAHRKSVYR